MACRQAGPDEIDCTRHGYTTFFDRHSGECFFCRPELALLNGYTREHVSRMFLLKGLTIPDGFPDYKVTRTKTTKQTAHLHESLDVVGALCDVLTICEEHEIVNAIPKDILSWWNDHQKNEAGKIRSEALKDAQKKEKMMHFMASEGFTMKEIRAFIETENEK